MHERPNVDIRPDHWEIVRSLLHKHVPQYEVWAFGSRAKWTAKDYSDLDLAVITDQPMALGVSASLSDDFSESDLPWKVDVVDWATTSESFRKIIARDRVVVQSPGSRRGGWDMSAEWPLVRLGDHVDACLGKMLDAKKNKGTPQPYLGNSNVRWGNFELSDLAVMRFEPDEEDRYGLLPGDLVVCEGGEPGRCAIWTAPVSTMKIQKALHRIRPKSTLNNYYLYHWFCHAAKTGALESHFTGTTIKHLTGKAVAALQIPLPPIGMQVAMVDVLRCLDDRIILLRETNATLEAIAQALFKSWFVDFDPVRAKMEGRVPEGMDEATAALFPDALVESELGLVPKGWINIDLAELTKRFGGSIQTGPFGSQLHASDYVPSGVPVVMPKDIVNRRASTESVARVGAADADRLARHKLQAGDIVFSRRGDVERHALITDREVGWLCGTGCLLLRPGHKWNSPGFLSMLLDEARARTWLVQHAVGATMPNLNTGILGSVPVVLPTPPVLNAFEELVSVTEEQRSRNTSMAESLAAIRDTLLPRLISGQLRLPEAQTAVAEASLA